MTHKCLIVDDEPLGIDVIKRHVKSFADFEITGCCSDALEAFEFLKSNTVHIIFLDINMPGVSGLDFIRSLKNAPLIVLTTAYREFAVEGFDLRVFDYLVKPIAYNRFAKTAHRIIEYFQELDMNSVQAASGDKGNFIFIKVEKKTVKIFFADILYIESLKDYVRVFTTSENYITHDNLGNITKSLPANKFIRIHRSYTVAVDRIKSLERNSVEIENKRLPIGRNYQGKIKNQVLMAAGATA